MVKYFCDCCKKEITNDILENNIFDMPRRVSYYTTSQGVKLDKFSKIKVVKTLLCDECITAIANMLSAVE